MLSKFSVKRPYTVLVGVVMILVLGYVAYTRMTADLLPNISFPYVIIITVDPGASPEEVEGDITAKLESSLATTSNLKTLQSMSRNSMSLVILEYEQTANMDSTMIELQQKLDQVKTTFAENVQAPMVMQINPDMLPIMVAAIGVENMDPTEITTYVDNNITPQLESIEGVASVTATGGIVETIQVTLNQDKIDKLNDKVMEEVRSQFKEAEDEIKKGKDEIESGKAELESGKQALANKISEGETQLNTQKIQLYTTASDLDRQLVELQASQQGLDNGIKSLSQAADGVKKLKDGIAQLDAGIKEMKALQESLTPLAAMTDEELLAATGMTREAYNKQMAELAAKITAAEAQKEALQAQLDTTNQQITTMSQSMNLSQYGIKLKSVDDLPEAIKALEAAKAQVAVGINTIQEAKKQVEAGKATIDQALTALNKSEILGSLQISDASTQLITGAAALDNAEKTMDTTKADAEAKADINSVLSADVIRQLLVAQNFDMPAGYINEEEGSYLIKVGESIKTVDDLEKLVLIDLGMDSIGKVYLTDIADVEVKDNSDRSYARVNGEPGLLLTFEKQTGYATGDVTDAILAKFESLEKTEEEKIHFSTMMNQGVYIDMIVKSILQNMGIGAILAILVLILFLRDFRPTLIIACAIPLSVVFAVVLMYFSNISLNIISMSGLALGIGMLVDNSIVVIENIFRLHKEGMSVKKACVNGASQVAGAITSSTLTTVCVFAPIIFTEGITRQLFVDMGLTILYTLAASLVVALTLVPAMAQGVLRRPKELKHGIYEKFLNGYGRFLRKAMKLKILVFLLAIGLLVVSVYLSLSRGTAFMPEMTSTQVTVTLSAPEEETREFEEMTGYSDTLMERLKDVQEIETIGAMVGSGTLLSGIGGGIGGGSMGGSGGTTSTNVTMYILLDQKSDISNEAIKEKILSAAEGLDCNVKVNTSMMDMSMLYGSGVSIQVRGRDLAKLQELARLVGEKLESVEGVTDVNNGLRNMEKEVYISVDKAKAAKYGMTVAQVFQLIYKKTAETSSSMKLSTASKDYEVYVNSAEQASMTKDDLSKMTFTYKDQKTGDEEEVPLTRVAEIGEREELSVINRESQTRYIQVSGKVAEGYNVGLVGNDVEKVIKDIEVPEGYSIKIGGENEAINDAMGQLVLMLLLAVILIYLIMVAQFQSLLSPFIIMFTIPLAFTGGFFALWMTGSEISVIALIGFVMLSGIIVNNGIVLVDYVNQLRRQGMAKKDAIVESSKTRLRPILMTALTTIISMSTMAVGMGRGSEMAQPMAIVTLGGLIYGTLLTLVVVPCIYDALNREKDMREEDIEIVKAEEDPDLAIEDPTVMMQTAGAAVTVDPGASAGGYDSGAGSGGYAAGEVPEHYGTERPVDGSNAGMTDGGPGNGNI